jgi:hypothetical protein
MNTLQQYEFDGKAVGFEILNDDVMVNATEMGKLFGRMPKEFLRNEQTKRFIEALEKQLSEKRSYKFVLPFAKSSTELDAKNTKGSTNLYYLLKAVDVKKGGQTWMHRNLALKFAAWLDPNFELWVYNTIETIVFGNLLPRRELANERAQVQKRIDEVISVLNDNPHYKLLQELEAQRMRLGRTMSSLDKAEMHRQMELNFGDTP